MGITGEMTVARSNFRPPHTTYLPYNYFILLMNVNPPSFETERFTVVLLSPSEGRQLVEILLQDEALAARVPWLMEKNGDGARREAFGIELQAAAGQIKVWGIVAREIRMQIGAIIARNSIEGVDVELLVASQYWGNGVVEEAGEPVIQWLEDNSELVDNFPIHLH